MNRIPVIDLTDALHPGSLRSPETAAAVAAAAAASGFFYVSHHGIPQALIDGQFEASRRFFDLSDAEKDAVHIRRSKTGLGYEALGAQTLDDAARPDIKESYQVGPGHPADHPYAMRGIRTYGPNLWPERLPDFAPQTTAYIEALTALDRRLVQLMALSLGLAESHFDDAFATPQSSLRMLRYPPPPAGADERTFGAGAHTDWGAVTVLAQDALGGLEVQMPDGTWTAAPPIPGTFVVNLGDMIPRWTNGRYHSNPHRVRNLNPSRVPRYSIAFFFSPDYYARIEALESCVPTGQQPLFPPCTAGEHLQEMYEKTYGLKTLAERATA